MTALKPYLEESGLTLAEFASRIGLSPEALVRVLSGDVRLTPLVASRIVLATSGAVTMEDLTGAGTHAVSIQQQLDHEPRLDHERLMLALVECLSLAAGGARIRPDIIAIGVEAIENAYAALRPVSARRGADLLALALKPVVAEILSETGGQLPSADVLSEAVDRGVEIYCR